MPLSQDRIEKMLGRYRERFIKHRAEVIARTEVPEERSTPRIMRRIYRASRKGILEEDGACTDVGRRLGIVVSGCLM